MKSIRLQLNADTHTCNAAKLTEILKTMGIEHEVKRPQAKHVLYAFLFGAEGAKLWSHIFGANDVEKGECLREEFSKVLELKWEFKTGGN
jgi:hypothetical protein